MNFVCGCLARCWHPFVLAVLHGEGTGHVLCNSIYEGEKMSAQERYEMDSNELYNRIAGKTGEDVETIASLGFDLYMFSDEQERESARTTRRRSVRV
jgi:hypothetical protein